jgi:carboxypeptidase Q
MRRWIFPLLVTCGITATLLAQSREKLDYPTLSAIKAEGLQRSQVMDHIWWLSEVYGPRVTGTPAIKQASAWAMKKFQEWGLANVHEEPWSFGKGWSLVRYSAHLVEPQIEPLIGYPKAWTPGTPGKVTAEVVYAPVQSEADFEKYRGKLRGKIVLTQAVREVKMLDGRIVLHMTPDDVAEARTTPIPAERRAGGRPDRNLGDKIRDFYYSEGVAALLDRGSDTAMVTGGSDLSWMAQRTDGGTVFVGSGGPRDDKAGKVPPALTLAVEQYNRMVRLLDRKVPVKVELDVQAKFYDETDGANGFNTIAEIPGTDLAREVVLLGAHLDTIQAGTGATDNACGVAAMMEALRILKAVGAKPRRTIRVGLWGGEEQGLLGSRAYAKQHYGDAATMKLLPEHDLISVCFNLDNGTGKVRGIWMQGNTAVKDIFEQWIEPLGDLGVNILGPRSVASTDHASFDAIGIPAFQFMVERLEYGARTHHSNMDVFDRVQRDDMIQEATVAAVFAYDAAMRDEKLPRKPLPKPAPAREADPA